MAGVLRLLLGLLLLPACWGVVRAFANALTVSAGADGCFNVESVSLLLGIVVFLTVWFFVPHPVRAYVLGHELTHALWGLMFGARPSRLKVGKSGGSVNLTKTNLLITLAPYFFPFYTFIVILVALAVKLFVRPQPLPWLPAWLFLVGLTWAFHVLFTLDTLAQKQPDIRTYGRVFSWVFIFLANLAVLLLWLVSTTSLAFSTFGGILRDRIAGAYVGVYGIGVAICRFLFG